LVLVVILVLVVVPVLIPVMVLVPAVIVLKPAAISIPVTLIKLLSVVARSDPPSASIGRPRPVAFMPLIAVADWIPIPVYPRILRAWTRWQNANHTGTRRWADSDAERNLSLGCRCTRQQDHDKEQGCSNEVPDDIKFSFTAMIYQIVQNMPPSEL
jgi:hypothetical protein